MKVTFALSDFQMVSRFYIFPAPPQDHLAVVMHHIGKTDGLWLGKANSPVLFNCMIYSTEGDY